MRVTSVLDIQAELHDVGQPYLELYEAVAALKRRHDLHPCAVRPRDGLSLRDDGERELVQDLVSRFRRLPEDARRKLPALWNSLGQLQVVVGDLDSSLADFEEVARLVSDPVSRAEAHHNVYRAALERRDWAGAFAALRRAVALDPGAFEPFPFARFEPREILGAGAAGVTFLCQDRAQAGRPVVVKALRSDSLDRDVISLFAEAGALKDLDHPTLLGVLDLGAAGADSAGDVLPRPYLVLEHFDGVTLQEYVAEHGPLSPDDWLELAWPLLRALQVLHSRGILHRALRPGCVLVRRARSRDGGRRLVVRLLDTGLALKRAVLHACASNPDACRNSGLGRSAARLLPYLPPEAVGRPRGQVWVGPHSDLYGFGRLSAFALTGRPDPDAADRMLLPQQWRQVLESCLGWTINRRPAHAGVVLDQLAQLPGADTAIARIERELHESAMEGLTARLQADPEDVEAYLRRAAAHLRQGDLEAAIADYGEALRRRPEDGAVYRQRARALVRANRPDEAIADYTEALRLEPRNLEALANRGLAYSQKGEHDRAIADYTEGLRLNHRDEVLYYNRGNAHYCKGDYDWAVADYTEALRLNPRGVWALGNRGKAYLLKGEPARACADFTRLLQLDPANVKALCDRAEANLVLGRVDAAVADYGEALRLQPSAALYHDRGLARVRARDYAGAIADFTEALALSPDNAAFLIARGKARADLGQAEQAVADFTQALQAAPQSTLALVQRADAYLSLGRAEEALADLTAAIALEPDRPSSRFRRGQLYAERGDDDRAIADFTEVLRLFPEDGESYRHRAEALSRRGELERARADLDRALELCPEDGEALAGRAAVRARLGDATGAVADLTELLRLQPGDADALVNRGNAYRQLGRLDEALADYSAAVAARVDCAVGYWNRSSLRDERGDLEGALADLDRLLELAPADVEALLRHGELQARLGRHDAALADNLEALARAPDDPRVLNNLGWLYATTPCASLRDGPRALEFALKAAAAGETVGRLDTLAAAYAACGRFGEAATAQRRAVELAGEAEAGELVARLGRYERGEGFVAAAGREGGGGP